MTPESFRSEQQELYEPEPKVNLQTYWFIVLKRRWVVLAVVLAIWLVAGVGSFLQTPRYIAASLIQIDGGRINLVQDVMIEDSRTVLASDPYATQEKILKSRVLAERVSEELALWEHPAFKLRQEPDSSNRPESLGRLAGNLVSMLRVSRIHRTQLMEVGFITSDPVLSAQLANALVRQYIQFSAEAESGLARDTSSFIREQIENLRQDIVTKEGMLRELSRDGETVMPDSANDGIVFQRLEELNRQLTKAESERAAAETHYHTTRNAPADSLPEVRNSVSIRDAKRTYTSLREQHRALSARFKPDWPEVKRLALEMKDAERSLKQELRAEAQKVVASSRVSFQTAVERERFLREKLNEQKAEVKQIHQATSDSSQLNVELGSQRQMLERLLQRRSETDLSADLGERQPVKVRIVEPAEAPGRLFSPNIPMNLLVGIVVGLCCGIGLAFLLDYLDNSITTVEDLRRHVRLPYLGMIPRYEEEFSAPSQGGQPDRLGNGQVVAARSRNDAPAKKISYLSTFNDRRHVSENRNVLGERMRFLRGSLLLSNAGAVPKVVLVTSPDQSCGKTFVSCNLSASLVELNKRVLLVDCDLRSPDLHKVFKYRNQVGLTNVLTGQRPLNDGCIMRTGTPNLFLLMAGPRSPRTGELLASPAMEQMLERCAEHFDYVVLDSAPLLPVFDSHALSTRCDAVLLVTRAGVTTRQSVKASLEHIQRVNGKITGVVLNDVNLTDYAQYYYHCSYSYEYGQYGEARTSRSRATST